MLIVQNIIDALKNQGLKPNSKQIDLVKKLCNINLNNNFSMSNIFSKNNLGFYIWGDVGRGKTIITKTFLDQLKRNDIKKFHYIDFMKFVHKELNNNSGYKEPLNKVAKILTKKIKIIFIDEFQVEDVADAMIVGDIIQKVINQGTRIILTSNAHPLDLYKDGLQRSKFIDSIKIFLKSSDVFKLEGSIDYRTVNILDLNTDDKSKIFNDEDIYNFIGLNFELNNFQSNKIKINDRKFSCKLTSNNILWIEFSSFFNEPTGSSDFEFICNKFDWIFISNFKKIDDDSIDLLRRFISFIDLAYINKSKIKFFLNGSEFTNLYRGSKLDNIWIRCLSRLSEMQTKQYFVK